MDPVCDDSRRFSGHVPATGSANHWHHRRGWGRTESHEEQQIQQQQQQQQQHLESESGVVSQRIPKQHILPQYQTQQITFKNPYRSQGNALHTVANLMLLFSGFTIALTLLERFCVDWLASGLPWW